MLVHAWEFAQRFKVLGEVSEAQIESYHYKFGEKQHRHHMNQAKKPAEQQRRALADTTLEAIRPLTARRGFAQSSRPLIDRKTEQT
jgi:hypothetical protein